MRYRINRIKISDFLDYYADSDSYIKFYRDYCYLGFEKLKWSQSVTQLTLKDFNYQWIEFCKKPNINQRCQKINSTKVIESLRKDFWGIDAELSFVGIYSFSLISKTLDHNHEKKFILYKDSFRVYFHIDKYPINYYNKEFTLRNKLKDKEMDLKPYDPLSEMVFLVFLGRLKGFNRDMGKEKGNL